GVMSQKYQEKVRSPQGLSPVQITGSISGLACLQQASPDTLKRNVSNLPDATLIDFEVEDVDDHVCSAIEEHNVTTDENMRAVGRRRGQTALQFLEAGVHALLKTWGKRAAANERWFQAGRQLIF